MFNPPDIGQIARQAHACWCVQMERDGWRPGTVYDEPARLHDAMGPFEDLDKRDQLSVMRAAKYEGIDLLASIVDHRRGPDRDFIIDEMRVGLRVACVDDDPLIPGEVTDWVTDDEGNLQTIIVRWPDGGITEHPAFGGELTRLDE